MSTGYVPDRANLRRAIASFGRGEILVLVDDVSEPSGASLIVRGSSVTTSQMAFIISSGSGLVEVALGYDRSRRLGIPVMSGVDLVDTSSIVEPLHGVTVDAADGITTGISAADRARTARIIASPETDRDDLRRPGHLLPVLVASHQLLAPASLAAGALWLAGRSTSVVPTILCALVSIKNDQEMASAEEARFFADARAMCCIALSTLRDSTLRSGTAVATLM